MIGGTSLGEFEPDTRMRDLIGLDQLCEEAGGKRGEDADPHHSFLPTANDPTSFVACPI